ncbi:MAG: hypothetical protein RI958_2319 [Actinomycetota bacterium]|jgi:uncharacterized membrane protein YdbT with pleckstrin-like domain
MTFAQKNLNPNETVALDLHPHWWFFAKPAIVLVLAVVVGVVLAAGDRSGALYTLLKFATIAVLVLSALRLLQRSLQWSSTHFVVTSYRVIFRSGVLAKSGIEIPLERINNVNFNQSIFERVIGAGDLMIESGGEDGQSHFEDVRHPDDVQKLIHAQMDAAMQRRVPGGFAAPRTNDVAEQLERLEGLMQRGAITPDEFETQKRKLLG